MHSKFTLQVFLLVSGYLNLQYISLVMSNLNGNSSGDWFRLVVCASDALLLEKNFEGVERKMVSLLHSVETLVCSVKEDTIIET